MVQHQYSIVCKSYFNNLGVLNCAIPELNYHRSSDSQSSLQVPRASQVYKIKVCIVVLLRNYLTGVIVSELVRGYTNTVMYATFGDEYMLL